jgi:site-specific DNA-methyltransferase (adenine-specific)
LWKQYERIIKDHGAICLFGSQPFTSQLINSNLKLFKYCLVWEKERPSNPALAKNQFMKWHEDICIFGKNKTKFNPQMEIRKEKNKRNNKLGITHNSDVYGNFKLQQGNGMADFKYPSSVLKFNVQRGLHPTQKPIALCEYLIKTYTNEGEIVLDNCAGSGTTAVASLNTGRFFIGIEKEPKYVEIARKRVEQAQAQRSLFGTM